MKLNIAYPVTGAQKSFDVDDERKLRIFYDKRMAQEVEGDVLGEEWKVGFGLVFAAHRDIPGIHFPYRRW